MLWQLDINPRLPRIALLHPDNRAHRIWWGPCASYLLNCFQLPTGRSNCSKQMTRRLWLAATRFEFEDTTMPDLNFPMPEQLAARLRAACILPTPQRLQVAALLFATPREHLTAEQILDRIHTQGGGCSRATVYNTLKVFTAHGLIKALTVSAERTWYDTNTTPHAHLHHIDSGQLEDFSLPSVTAELIRALPTYLRLIDINIVLQVRNQ